MSKPPPLHAERRRDPRIDLIAQVQVKKGGEVFILQARNVSAGGLFLEANPAELPQLAPPIEVDVDLSPADDPESPPISMRARIVRVERGTPSGFGLSIVRLDAASQSRLRKLLSR